MIGHTVFDIEQIFMELYGYKPPRVGSMPTTSFENPFGVSGSNTKKTMTQNGSRLYGPAKDVLGREVFCPLTIVTGVNPPHPQVYEFPYAVLSLKNEVIYKKTQMVERGGAVIEEIGVGPWEIRVKGFFIDPDNVFPDVQLTLLNELYNYRQPVSFRSALTDQFLKNDDMVVIVDLEIPPKQKVIGVRDYAFTVIQDTILDLYKID